MGFRVRVRVRVSVSVRVASSVRIREALVFVPCAPVRVQYTQSSSVLSPSTETVAPLAQKLGWCIPFWRSPLV